jgi:hypothetical protein
MVFQYVATQPIAGLSGVLRDSDQVVPLGSPDLCWHTGNHFVGVDATYQPLVMRAYWDIAEERRSAPQVGYVQFARVQYDGQPVAPDVYGGQLVGRSVYDGTASREIAAAAVGLHVDARDSHWFVDFMDPSFAVVPHDVTTGLPPFYAFNTALRKQITSWTDLLVFDPDANGHFSTNVARYAVVGQVLGPTIAAEIPTGLFTSPALVRLIADRQPDGTMPFTAQQAAAQPFYEAALHLLGTTENPFQPLLAGLQNSDLTARAIGELVLIGIPDEEDLGPTLCPHHNTGAGRVDIRLLQHYELESAESSAVAEAMTRMSYTVRSPSMMAQDWARGRGDGGLDAPAYRPPDRPVVLGFRTWAMSTAIGGRLVPLSGFEWSVTLRYDPDARDLQLSSIEPPVLLRHCENQPEINTYAGAIQQAAQQPIAQRPMIDTSNFLLADVRRSNFARIPWGRP